MSRVLLRQAVICVAALVAALACKAGPAIADTALGHDPVINVATTGTDAPGCGTGLAAPCKTIGYAVTFSAASGDTIKVAAGIYDSDTSSLSANAYSSLHIDKPLHFEGAQAGQDARGQTPGGLDQTIIEFLGNPALGPGNLWSVDASNVTVDGFTFENNHTGAGIQINPDRSDFLLQNCIFSNNQIAGLYLGTGGASQSVIRHNLFLNNNNGGPSGNGIYSDTSVRNVVIEQNRFRGNLNTPVLIDTADHPSSGITIRDNDMDGEGSLALFHTSDVSITGNSMTGGGPRSGVAIAGADHHILIERNRIAGKKNIGVQVGDFLAQPGGPPTANTDVTVADNSISGVGVDGVQVFGSTGVHIRHNQVLDSGNDGIALTAPADTPASSDVTITQNTILRSRGKASGIDIAAGSYTGTLTIHYNRIVYSVSGHGLVNNAHVPVDARLNWWGCNAMPGGRGCDHLTGTHQALISFQPWLVLRISSVPSGILAGQRAVIRSGLRHDSAGALTRGPFFAPVITVFSAILGRVSAADVLTTLLLHAQTGWPAGQPRPRKICSHVDNQTVCLVFPALPPAFPVTG